MFKKDGHVLPVLYMTLSGSDRGGIWVWNYFEVNFIAKRRLYLAMQDFLSADFDHLQHLEDGNAMFAKLDRNIECDSQKRPCILV